MKKIIVAICILLTISLWAEELPKIEYDKLTIGEEQTLEVMTWNIQNFPKSEHTVAYAVGIISAIDADVIGLQEIESDSAFVVLLNNLQKQNPEDKWNGFRANTNEWEMNLAYLYKSSLINVDSIYQIYPDDEIYHQPFPRKPLMLEFSYFNQKLFVINNHLKAMPGEKNIVRRREACKLLDEYIDEFLPEENVILLGDLNDQLTDEVEENSFNVFLDDKQNYYFTDWEIAADSTANWSYPYWKYRGHIDHILISNELYDEFENSGSFVKVITIDKFMEDGEDSRYKYITDHRPVVIRLKF
ncbi:MAG: endonuclease/exonuclease/phosphatase family protein [Candidatus Cloacimonetes bacterium]|jgi:endonuclease/exonuclease/phosphatase family metal-dependent hydrolase|nr:endonuclease/exonuclease/phosphatase family protein [Candidatus Cloacimonadota bacterium]